MKSKQLLHHADIIYTLSTLNSDIMALFVTHVLIIMHSSVPFIYYVLKRGPFKSCG